MNQKITTHMVSENDGLTITVVDDPSFGGASHRYLVSYEDGAVTHHHQINFQYGAVRESGINGLTHESLLAIIEHRLASFQKGKFACDENELALHHVRIALECLKSRTMQRLARGVEGTHKL